MSKKLQECLQQPKLVIYDCDGVLVDTEVIANQQIAAVMTELGAPMSGHQCREMFQGSTLEDVARRGAEIAGVEPDEALTDLFRQRIVSGLDGNVKPVSGAVELVHKVHAAGLAYCVASSGSVAKMNNTLGQVGLLDILGDVLLSAQDVGRGKPFPDVFLAALEIMDKMPDEAVIIEDSLSGVKAGVDAGIRVVAYCGDPFTNAENLENAGAEIAQSMDDVANLIGLAN